jgi:alkaline phosphatase D
MNYRDIVARMQARVTAQPFNRRTFVMGSAAAAIGLAYPAMGRSQSTPVATPVFGSNPFTLGVASGEPLADGVVLWTRLAPQPFEDFGGMPMQPVDVQWRIATDEQLHDVVQSGTAIASPDWAHSVHVEVAGLEADRPYWYQFQSGNELSPVGRTRTAPAAGTMPDQLRFAFASCQRWDQGLYTAWRDVAAQDVDLVIHLGDYIYESKVGLPPFRDDVKVPVRVALEPMNLEHYRFRYALYKQDPHLQEAHRLAPWLVTWDDHEVNNNFFGAVKRDEPAAQVVLERRAAAYQAYYEHQPLRKESIPDGPDLQLFRKRQFGDLMQVNVLDTRQYRSAQGINCDDASRTDGFCADSLDPARSLLGERQKAWLLDGFGETTARWNLIANQVPMARIDNDADPEKQSFGGKEMDKWDGYAYERDEVVQAMAAAAQENGFHPVVITGDVHSSYVWDLKTDWDDPSGETVFGTEFVGTSISSNGDNPLRDDGGFTTQCGNRNGNPHNHFFDNHRGYVLCDVGAERYRADYRVMPNVSDPAAEAISLATFSVAWDQAGAQVDSSCEPAVPGGES